MHELLAQLNSAQAAAVTATEGPVLVLAGAGSGKTRVLTYRIAYLIGEKHVPPENILAITFTNKAAAEMKSRLTQLVGEDANDIWARTFHSACVRILRQCIDRIGYERDFTIYDTADQKTVIKACIKELHLSDKEFPVAACMRHISGAKDTRQTPEEFAAQYKGDYRMEGYCNVYTRYQKKLQSSNAVDFDDLLCLTVRVFEECPEVLEYYRNKFRYIHVDEYQDTNAVQYRLVSLLAEKHRNLCVVGDEDQSIYKFRGADIRNILRFERTFPDAKTIRLEQNYRSTQTILDAANGVIARNSERLGKHLWTDNGEGKKITDFCGMNERGEAQFIVEEALRLNREEGMPYSEMVVLYRMNAQSRPIEEQFLLNAVPYKVVAGHRFYDLKEIKDTIAYLRVLNNPNDTVSLMRVINEPKRGIGSTSLEKATGAAAAAGKSLYEVLTDNAFASTIGATWTKMCAFAQMMDALREETQGSPLKTVITAVLEKTGYAAQYAGDATENVTRTENLKEFLSVGVNYDNTAEAPSLADFLDNVSLVSDIDDYDEENDMVTLMTIHSAKGLEFPAVFLCGFEEGVFPSYRAITESAELEEERRLCYVAITRAKARLYVTHAQSRMLFGATTYNKVSRFLGDIPPTLFASANEEPTTNFAVPKRSPRPPSPIQFGSTLTTAAKPPAAPPCDLQPGDRVSHKKFGFGTVLTAVPVGNDTKLEISFENTGKKVLLATYARLTKI